MTTSISASLISVVIPVRNGARWLETAVNSVLGQTYQDFEVLLINDHSEDESTSIIERYVQRDSRIRFLDLVKGEGLVDALNLGLSESNGTWIARLDADDVMEPERLARQHSFFKDSNLILLGTNVHIFTESNRFLGTSKLPTRARDIQKWLKSGRSPFAHPSVMFRRDAVEIAGGYSSEYPHAEDFELWCRLQDLGKCANLTQGLTKYRVHSDQVSSLHGHIQQFSTLRAVVQHFPSEKTLLGRVQNDRLSDSDLDVLSSVIRGSVPRSDSLGEARRDLAVLFSIASKIRRAGRLRDAKLGRLFFKDPKMSTILAIRSAPYLRRSAIAGIRRK